MDFFEVLKKRRSVRKFTDSEVPEDVMRKCLKLSLLAPNSSNIQPWEFYWVRNLEKKRGSNRSLLFSKRSKNSKRISSSSGKN